MSQSSEADRLAALLDARGTKGVRAVNPVKSSTRQSKREAGQGAAQAEQVADLDAELGQGGDLASESLRAQHGAANWQGELRSPDGRVGVQLASGKQVFEERLSLDELRAFAESVTVFKDDTLWIINKPAGLLSVPGRVLKDSLLRRLEAVDDRVKLVHRLDMETSGIMVFGLSAAAQTHVSKQFIERTTEKRYEALLSGHLDSPLGALLPIDIPVRYDPPNKPRHITDTEFKKQALTNLWLIAHETLSFEPNVANSSDYAAKSLEQSDLTPTSIKVSRVTLEPVTGRSHQLRVHALYIGHAMIGDPIYATGAAREAVPNLALFSKSLTLMHPKTGEVVSFSAPVPF